MSSIMQMSTPRNNFGGGRNANNPKPNGNNRMHPYDRNGSNNFGRGNQMRNRNQNMRNDFRKGIKFAIYLKSKVKKKNFSLIK